VAAVVPEIYATECSWAGLYFSLWTVQLMMFTSWGKWWFDFTSPLLLSVLSPPADSQWSSYPRFTCISRVCSTSTTISV